MARFVPTVYCDSANSVPRVIMWMNHSVWFRQHNGIMNETPFPLVFWTFIKQPFVSRVIFMRIPGGY